MGFKAKQILLKYDFIGAVPEFRVLDETRYKSIFSSILSILLIIFSIVFVIYSFIEYLNQNPKIEYYKNNDNSTNKTFLISDSLLMFQFPFICYSNLSVKPTAEIISFIEGEFKDFTLEPCELGKNLNPKYKELIEKFEKIESWKLENFYCINYNGSNVTLYSHPSLAYINENYLIFKLSSECQNFFLNLILVTENDFIDHTNTDNPIVPYYQKNQYMVLHNDETDIEYNYQYIKYESDNGIFFNDKTTLNGIGVHSSNSNNRNDLYDHILSINFRMNSANYDLYRRTFIKFQSFLADVMSLINLLITISKVVTEFLLYKKMHKDIIKYIITSNNNIKENKIGKEIFQNKLKSKKIFDIYDCKGEKFEKKINQNQVVGEKVNSKISLEVHNKDCTLEMENEDKNIIKVMKILNITNIIKSFFCLKDRKLKLINLCNDIVNKDICIERILKRLYTLENQYNSLIEEDSSKSFINSDISKIKNIIKKINNEANKQIKN
jgi:hypothetical protein